MNRMKGQLASLSTDAVDDKSLLESKGYRRSSQKGDRLRIT